MEEHHGTVCGIYTIGELLLQAVVVVLVTKCGLYTIFFRSIVWIVMHRGAPSELPVGVKNKSSEMCAGAFGCLEIRKGVHRRISFGNRCPSLALEPP